MVFFFCFCHHLKSCLVLKQRKNWSFQKSALTITRNFARRWNGWNQQKKDRNRFRPTLSDMCIWNVGIRQILLVIVFWKPLIFSLEFRNFCKIETKYFPIKRGQTISKIGYYNFRLYAFLRCYYFGNLFSAITPPVSGNCSNELKFSHVVRMVEAQTC